MKAKLKELANAAGFDACGFVSAKAAPHSQVFLSWLEAGLHAGMGWLARNPERRADPRNVLPGCQTVIVLAKSYFQGEPPARPQGQIARYACGTDYHDLMLVAMRPLCSFLEQQGGVQKPYVDTGPILERDFAAESGIAWQGKSTMCLSQRLGTWFFLGVILTTLPIDPDPPARNRCGSCVRCIDACPTGAITAAYQLDARRCISYLTIENKGSIPLEYRHAVGDRIYGCDDCLEVCPWNRFAVKTREDRFNMPARLQNMPLTSLAILSDNEFRSLFRDSPIYRIKRNRFVRNVCVALGNIGGKDDLPVLRKLTHDTDALVAEHASWAVREIEGRLGQASTRRSEVPIAKIVTHQISPGPNIRGAEIGGEPFSPPLALDGVEQG